LADFQKNGGNGKSKRGPKRGRGEGKEGGRECFHTGTRKFPRTFPSVYLSEKPEKCALEEGKKRRDRLHGQQTGEGEKRRSCVEEAFKEGNQKGGGSTRKHEGL